MANAKILEPFIKEKEGGLSKNVADFAAKDPCPFPFKGVSGWHTNKGITWSVWKTVYGDTELSATRFFIMSDDDWLSIFKPFYWDKCLGDKINSQRIANVIVDWVWCSGQHYPELEAQEIMNHIAGKVVIVDDGYFGNKTITLLNSEKESVLYTALIQGHIDYINRIVEKNPSQVIFKNGWINRVKDLVKFNLQFFQ